jgi:hypothetical protein
MHEDLALMGEVVMDDNFCSIILGSLHSLFDTFLTSITNQISPIPYQLVAKTIGSVAYPQCVITISPPRITPNDLMEILGQEANQCGIQAGQTKKEESDAEFVAHS